MKEGAYELLQGDIRKVSLVNYDHERILKENDIEQLFGINIEERLKEGEYYLMFEISFNQYLNNLTYEDENNLSS